jgi:hypothetical protein
LEYVTLGCTAHDRAGMMQMGRVLTAARKNEAVERCQGGVERIDPFFDPRNLPFADSQRLYFAVLPLRTAQVAAQIEEVVLNVGQDIANTVILNMQQRYADNRIRFVNAAVRRDAHVELRQPCPVAERRASVVAGASVDPIEFHGVFRCGRVGLLGTAPRFCRNGPWLSRACTGGHNGSSPRAE